MSRETTPPQYSQSSAFLPGAVTPTSQYEGTAFDQDAYYRQRPSEIAEPRTPNTIHLTPSASRQQGGTNLPSEASSTSLHFDSSVSLPPAATALKKASLADRLKRKQEELKQHLHNLPSVGDKPRRLPASEDFPPSLRVQIIPEDPDPEEAIKHAVVLLPQLGNFESSLKNLARRLHRKQPETCFVLLQEPEGVPTPNSKYDWTDTSGHWDEPSLNSAGSLTEMIKSSLITNCRFAPRNILLIGHGQGGMAVLSTAALWADTELGGVVSIGGPLPSYLSSASLDMISTPALVVGSTMGEFTQPAFNCVRTRFRCVDTCVLAGVHDTLPATDEMMKPLLEFLAHRLLREEWSKQAIISFDGGGIRGYGSLLILQDLMNKIGDEEKRLDALEGNGVTTTSSFAPWPYKPTDPDRSRNAVASPTEGLPNSSLFLPCHYFDYAAGTSTGGLISIMLSRLRMTVDDCIAEYENFGQRVFGNPRPLALGAVMWHKFDHRVLQAVIESVTERHSGRNEEFDLYFPCDEELCKTLVMAYAEHDKTEAPYLFRTYRTASPSPDQKKTKQRQTAARNHGPAANLPIWQIGRATSAAPKYFPPIRIKKSVDGGPRSDVRFKDGGFGCNNPSEEAYYDIVHKHGDHSKAIGPFISISTGIVPLDLFARASGNFPNALANWNAAKKHPARTLHAHDAMTRLADRDGKTIFPYYRFDGGKLLGEVKLDEWESYHFTSLTSKSKKPGSKTLDKIYMATATYLHDRDVERDLNECAKLLVSRRRLRARDASAWDQYASASFYECSYKKCQTTRINTAQSYRDHVRREHSSALADQPLELALTRSRRCWIYGNDPPVLKPKGKVRQDLSEGSPTA